MKETGMSLEDLKRYTKSWELGDEGINDMLEILIHHRKKVLEKLETYKKTWRF